MKRHFTFLTVVLSFFILFSGISCSEAASLKSKIIGKWFRVDGNEQIEFLKDGTVIVGSDAGDYKFIDDNRLRLDFKIGVKVFEVSIDKEGGLNLKEPTGRSSRYLLESHKKAEEDARRKANEERLKAFQFSDLTVLDKETKLMWARNGNITGKEMSWNDAFESIKKLNEQKYAGYSDWRLPTREELETIIDFAKSQGYSENLAERLNEIFKNVWSGNYWSSTTYDRNSAWVVGMYTGYVNYGYKKSHNSYNKNRNSDHYVWPVRAGQ